jgi:GNAT superfamily N-acetyltransferase
MHQGWREPLVTMAPAMLVRPAAIADLESMVSLLGLLLEQESDFSPNRDKQRQALLAILEAPGAGRLLVAESGTQVVGMVSLLFTISTAEGGLAAWLEDMVVHPEWRNNGIGARLVEAAVRACQERGIRRITLLTDFTNHFVQRFYERQGFVRSAMVPYRRYC